MPSGVFTRTKEHKANIAKAMRGENNPAKRPEVREKLSKAMQGKFSGSKSRTWKGGVSQGYKRKSNPEYQKALLVRTTYCEICGVEEEQLTRKLSYDHYHKTGNFRGWLCANCNRGIGLLNDDPELLEKAVRYLKEHAKSE